MCFWPPTNVQQNKVMGFWCQPGADFSLFCSPNAGGEDEPGASFYSIFRTNQKLHNFNFLSFQIYSKLNKLNNLSTNPRPSDQTDTPTTCVLQHFSVFAVRNALTREDEHRVETIGSQHRERRWAEFNKQSLKSRSIILWKN